MHRHLAKHNWLGDHNVRSLGKPDAADGSTSTMDAEYQVCVVVAREALALQIALSEFESVCSDFTWDSPLIVFCCTQAALTLCQDRKESQRVKHIDIIHHFARDHVASGGLQFLYCRSEGVQCV